MFTGKRCNVVLIENSQVVETVEWCIPLEEAMVFVEEYNSPCNGRRRAAIVPVNMPAAAAS